MKKVIAISIFTIFLAACPKTPFHGTDDTVFEGILYYQKQATTPEGVRVYARFDINTALLAQIDQGRDYGIQIAKAPPYNYPVDTNGLYAAGNYQIWLFKRSSQCQQAAFTTRADGSPWDGTDFDKDPAPGKVLLCVAGLMMRTGANAATTGSPGLVTVDDAASIATIVRFEGEHNILLDYDQPKYNATSGVHSHPLLPDPNRSETFDGIVPVSLKLPLDITDENGKVIFAKGGTAFALITG